MSKQQKNKIISMGIINGVELLYCNGNVYAIPTKKKNFMPKPKKENSMTINFQRDYKNDTSNRVFIIFSSDDMTVLKVFISNSVAEDLKTQAWIIDNGYDENRIEYMETEDVRTIQQI